MGSVQPRQIQEVGSRLKSIFNSPIPHHQDLARLGYRPCTQGESDGNLLRSQEKRT